MCCDPPAVARLHSDAHLAALPRSQAALGCVVVLLNTAAPPEELVGGVGSGGERRGVVGGVHLPPGGGGCQVQFCYRSHRGPALSLGAVVHGGGRGGGGSTSVTCVAVLCRPAAG